MTYFMRKNRKVRGTQGRSPLQTFTDSTWPIPIYLFFRQISDPMLIYDNKNFKFMHVLNSITATSKTLLFSQFSEFFAPLWWVPRSLLFYDFFAWNIPLKIPQLSIETKKWAHNFMLLRSCWTVAPRHPASDSSNWWDEKEKTCLLL